MKSVYNKKAAMELSISTIVIVVLGLSMLILGAVLINSIFNVSNNAIDQVGSQTIGEINKLFGEKNKVVLYPLSGTIKVRQGKVEGFAIGIKNTLTGSSATNAKFAYLVTPVDFEECGMSKEEIMTLFSGKDWKGEDLLISTEDSSSFEVFFDPREGDPLCSVKFRIDVTYDGGKTYSTSLLKTVEFVN